MRPQFKVLVIAGSLLTASSLPAAGEPDGLRGRGEVNRPRASAGLRLRVPWPARELLRARGEH